jgi:GAF domain-containing protein
MEIITMLKFFELLFTVRYSYTDRFEAIRAQNLLRILIGVGIAILVMFVLPGLFSGTLAFNVSIFVSLAFALIVLGYWAIQTGRSQIVSYFIIMLLALGSILSLSNGFSFIDLVTFLIPVIFAGLLTSRRILLIVAGVTLLSASSGIFISSTRVINLEATPQFSQLLFIGTSLAVTVGILYIFGNSSQNLLRQSFLELNQLSTFFNTKELYALDLTSDQVLLKSLKTFKEQLMFSHAQVHMYEESRQQVQTYYIGAISDELQEGSIFNVNVINALGEAIRTNQLLVITPDSQEVRQRHLLPAMEFGIVIPMVHNNEVLGVLDLQNARNTTFTTQQLETFDQYAEHLSAAWVRANLVQQLREDIQQQENTIQRQRQRMRDLELSPRQVTTPNMMWQSKSSQEESIQGFDLQNAQIQPANQLTPEMVESLNKRDLITKSSDNQLHVSAPIFLRDQLLGALSFTIQQTTILTERQRELITSVTQRLALAIENKRLFEQSQSQAMREIKANEVAGILLSSTDIQTVLNLAAESVNNVLSTISTQIHLQKIEELDESR